MNAFIGIHKDGAAHVRDMLPHWRKTFSKITWGLNCDEADGEWWPLEHDVFIAEGFGRTGPSSLKKAHSTIRRIAGIEGTTCIAEYDSLILPGNHAPPDGELWGSRIFTDGGCGDYIAHLYMHSPYLATQATWQTILAVLDRWQTPSGYVCTEHFMGDRWLCLAAATSGIRLVQKGFSEQTLNEQSAIHAREAIRNGATFIHGIKWREVLEIILTPPQIQG